MRNDNGSSWFNVFVAVVLIVMGFLDEPLLAVLGGMVLFVTLLTHAIEEYRNRKLRGTIDEQVKVYSEQLQTLASSSATSVIR